MKIDSLFKQRVLLASGVKLYLTTDDAIRRTEQVKGNPFWLTKRVFTWQTDAEQTNTMTYNKVTRKEEPLDKSYQDLVTYWTMVAQEIKQGLR